MTIQKMIFFESDMINADHLDEIVDIIDINKHNDTLLTTIKIKILYHTNHIQRYVMIYIIS